MIIINLTQHAATPEQRVAGVVDLQGPAHDVLVRLLTVGTLPTGEEIVARCATIAHLVSGDSRTSKGLTADRAMIGGAPWMMARLEAALIGVGVRPVYAFAVRESVEEVQQDGSVRKIGVFRHAGFIDAI